LPELGLFAAFFENELASKGIEAFRTEWRIAAPEHSLAGSVDFVGKCADGTYVICDWKRSKKLLPTANESKPWQKKARPPIQHLDDNDTTKYFLQLNIYRYVLQKHYGLTISRMVLANFLQAASSGPYHCFDVPIMEAEVEAILRAPPPPPQQPQQRDRGQASSPPASTAIARPF